MRIVFPGMKPLAALTIFGGHELGHAILDAYGINPGTRWLNELVASYVLYA